MVWFGRVVSCVCCIPTRQHALLMAPCPANHPQARKHALGHAQEAREGGVPDARLPVAEFGHEDGDDRLQEGAHLVSIKVPRKRKEF